MKNILKVVVALVFLMGSLCASTKLLEKMPSSNKVVLLFDIEKCLTIPVIKDGLDTANQDPNIQQFVQATGFGIEDCKKIAVTLDLDLATGQPNKDSALMLIELKKAVDLAKIIAAGSKNNNDVDVQKQSFNGQDFYLLKNKIPSPVGMEGMDEVGLFKLEDTLLAVGAPAAVKESAVSSSSALGAAGVGNAAAIAGESSTPQSASAGIMSNKNLMNLLGGDSALFSLAVDTSSQPQTPPQPGQMPNPMSNVKGLALSGDMKSGDLYVNVHAECFKAEQAAGLMFMYNMMVTPQLQKPDAPIKANELTASVDQSALKIQLHLTKARLEEIRTQIELMKQLQGQAPAPGQGLTPGNLIK